jgi:transposase
MTSAIEIVRLGSKTFDNNPKGFSLLLEWVCQKNKKNAELLPGFTIEATGVYYEGLAYFLIENGYTVHVVLPNQSKKYGQSLGARSKTDKIDAQILAQMGLERKLNAWKPISSQFLNLKQLTRERDAIICEKTCVSNQLHAYRHQAKPNAASVRRAEKRIDLLKQDIAEIEKEIEALVASDQTLAKRLDFVLSIPGVGLLTAITVVAETNGFASITGIKQLTGFAGLDVKIAESGKWKGKSKISKQGNCYIRKAMLFPAFSKIKKHEKTKKYYERLVEKKGLKMVAAVAVQRKLLGLIYTLWKKQEMVSDQA